MQPTYYVKHPDGTYSPVEVPAAGVQGDVMRALNDARNTAMKNAVVARIPECADFAAIAQNLDWAMDNITNTVQPDSGRDAALEQSEVYRMQMAAICTAALGYWDESMGISQECDTPALRDVAKLYAKYAALAAHPANGAQAGEEPHWLDSPQSALGDKTAREGYAANPDYSGAQAVALPEGWRIVPKKTCYALVEGNTVIASLAGPDAEENAAIIARILAAAKKGS